MKWPQGLPGPLRRFDVVLIGFVLPILAALSVTSPFDSQPSSSLVTKIVLAFDGLQGDFSGILPGDLRSGRLLVTNASEREITYQLALLPPGGSSGAEPNLADVLNITLTLPGPDGCAAARSPLYAGPLRELALPAGGLEVAGGQVSALCLSVDLPLSTASDYQRAQAGFAIAIAAVGNAGSVATP